MPAVSHPTARSHEAEAFLDHLQHTEPSTVTACTGWTAHELTAHLAGAAAEVTRHLEPYLQGDPVPATQSFEVREAPFRSLSDASLRVRLESEEERMRSTVDEVLAREPDAVIPWTGRRMKVASFVPHLRNEFALHLWDCAGDGDTTDRLLAQAELTRHSVGVLGEILVRAGRAHDPCPDEDFHVRLRAEGAPDVDLVVTEGQAGLRIPGDGDRDDAPHVELDAAARNLMIWGRRPDRRGRIVSHLSPAMLGRLQALLSGY